MNYRQAKKDIWKNRLFGWLLGGVSFLMLTMGIIKYTAMMAGLDKTSILSNLSQGIYSLIHIIYQKTQFLSWFWKLSPNLTLPTGQSIQFQFTAGNTWAIVLFASLFLAGYLLKKAQNMQSLLAEVEHEQAKEKIHATIHN